MNKQISIGEEKAIALYTSGWWRERPAKEVALFQLSTVELSLPLDEFHRCVKEALGRPVWTCEFAVLADLRAELLGDTPPPTMREILELFPADNAVVIVMDVESEKETA